MSAQYDTSPNRELSRLLDAGASKVIEIKDDDGRPIKTQVVDNDIMFWLMHDIGNEKFGSYADASANLEVALEECKENMPMSMYLAVRRQVMGLLKRSKWVVASKNSESVRGGQASSTIQHRMARQSTEHIYESPNQATQSFIDQITGKDGRQ